MDALWSDLRFAVRALRNSPTFTIVAVLTLAIGIGANTAVFSVVDAVFLRPMPYTDPDRLVFITQTTPQGSSPSASPTKFRFWIEHATAVQDLTAFHFGVANLTGTNRPEQVGVVYATAAFFRLFGAHLVQGRGFSAAEDRPHGDHVVIVTESLWHRRFGGEQQLAGKIVHLDGIAYSVIGIVGADFDGPALGGPFAQGDVYVPLQMDLTVVSNGNFFSAAGRLAPGVTLRQARDEFQRLAGDFRRVHPSFLRVQDSFSVQRFQDVIVGDLRPVLLAFVAAVTLVLLIACANVASLLMARAAGRVREVAIRAALGAERWRIVRQLMTESVLLAAVAGAVGIIGGIAGVRALLTLNVAQLPRVSANGANVTVDGRVLAFTVMVSLVTGIVFGLVPGLRLIRQDVSSALMQGGDRSSGTAAQARARGVLVGMQVALAVTLLVSALLLIRSFVALRSVDPGFDMRGVLTARMSLTEPRFSTTAAVNALIGDAVNRIQTIPGVTAASASCCLPLQDDPTLRVNIVGRPLEGAFHVMAGWRMVSPGFLDVFRVPLVRGRRFRDGDNRSSAPVVLINEAMARRFWPGGNPLGEHLVLGKGLGPEFEEPPREIVGVVADVRDVRLNQAPKPSVYVPLAQLTDRLTAVHFHMLPIVWVIRTEMVPAAIAPAVEEQLQQASGGVPLTRVWSMDSVLSRSTARSDFNTVLMTSFAAAAVLLAAIGIFGLVAYSVQQRRREIAIRVAVGAGTADIRKLIVWGNMRFVLAGALIGVAGAFASTRLLAALLFGVTVYDGAAFTTAPLVITAVALSAMWAPARQAVRIDPAVILRGD
jgi:putative ABC transport system permease protein